MQLVLRHLAALDLDAPARWRCGGWWRRFQLEAPRSTRACNPVSTSCYLTGLTSHDLSRLDNGSSRLFLTPQAAQHGWSKLIRRRARSRSG
jgi:hypothetical protein